MGDRDPGSVFGLFVSSVEGQPVSRFGSDVMIGAERDLADRKLVRYTPELVVAIPHEEARKYAREYRRAITDGSLKARTVEEWQAQNAPPAPEPEPEPASDPEPDSDPELDAPASEPALQPASEPPSEPLTTRKIFQPGQARLTSLTADDPPDKDEAPTDAHYESRR